MAEDYKESPPSPPPHTAVLSYGYPTATDDDIDLFQIGDVLWRGKWWIVLATLICAGVGGTYALLAEKFYEARTVMVPAQDEQVGGFSALANQFGGLASLAGVDLGNSGGKIEEAKEVLKSYAFTARFIRDEELMPILFPTDERSKGAEPSMQMAYKLFEELRRIETNNTTGVITLRILWKDPALAASWANKMIARVNSEMRGSDVAEAESAVRFLKERLTETDVVEMQETLYRLIESQAKTIMLANVRDDYVFRVVDPAYVPDEPSRPKVLLVIAGGAVLGGVLGIFVVMTRHFRQRRIQIGLDNRPDATF